VASAQLPVATELVATGLVRPILVTAPPGDETRLFVVQQYGRVRVIKHGVLLQAAYLDLFAEVSKGGEQGTLGLAFDPEYAANGHVYVLYTDLLGDTVLERFSASVQNPDVVDPSTRKVMLGPVYQPQETHNGSCLAFGPDGKLYVGMGDGGGSYDSGPGHGLHGNAQSGTTLLGKLLRLDVRLPWPHVPPDNPWVGTPFALDPIWAFGLRMPWRFSFDRETGALYLGDVGEGTREEVDYVPPGTPGGFNFGWRCSEGSHCTGLSGCACNGPHLWPPIAEWAHPEGCCVIGGFVYRGSAIPELHGWYVHADLCAGLRAFRYDGQGIGPVVDLDPLLDPPGGPVIDRVSSLGEDARGELYVCDLVDGEIFRIVRQVPPPPFSYCTAKPTSCGTVPSISASGESSATATSGFVVEAGRARKGKLGILLFTDGGRREPPTPFSGGWLCLSGAVRRGPPTAAAGSGNACKSVFALDMNAFAAGLLGKVPPAWLSLPGTQVDCQWWGRDTFAQGDYLSDALEYRVGP
jgi:glucose/arabinose dehydrogenase